MSLLLPLPNPSLLKSKTHEAELGSWTGQGSGLNQIGSPPRIHTDDPPSPRSLTSGRWFLSDPNHTGSRPTPCDYYQYKHTCNLVVKYIMVTPHGGSLMPHVIALLAFSGLFVSSLHFLFYSVWLAMDNRVTFLLNQSVLRGHGGLIAPGY